MKIFSFFQKKEDQEPDVHNLPEQEQEEAPEPEEEVTLGTKVKVVAALAVVGFATYVAYWVQEPTDYKAQLIDPGTLAEEEMAAEEPVEEAMMAQADEEEVAGPVQEVSIVDFTYTPANITVEEGTTVVWTNIDAVEHTVTGDVFTSEVLNPGDSFVYTFEEAGTFDYFCSIHPQMTGEVTVTSGPVDAEALAETDEPVITSVEEDAESLSPELLTAEEGDVITLDAQELLSEPPMEEMEEMDEPVILSVTEEAATAEPSRAAAEDQPDQLTKSGPEDVLYVLLFGGILYLNRRKLIPQSAKE